MAEMIDSEDSNSPEVLSDMKAAMKQYADLFETNLGYDIEFLVDGLVFRAHKLILKTRSEYFRKMFENWGEKGAEQIPINLVKAPVFNLVLEFIYKAQLSNRTELEAHAIDLMKTADMFQIVPLRRKCEKYIIRKNKINVQNACKYAVDANNHNAEILKAAALQFIKENHPEVKKTAGYIELKRNKITIAEAMELASPSKRPRLSD